MAIPNLPQIPKLLSTLGEVVQPYILAILQSFGGGEAEIAKIYQPPEQLLNRQTQVEQVTTDVSVSYKLGDDLFALTGAQGAKEVKTSTDLSALLNERAQLLVSLGLATEEQVAEMDKAGIFQLLAELANDPNNAEIILKLAQNSEATNSETFTNIYTAIFQLLGANVEPKQIEQIVKAAEQNPELLEFLTELKVNAKILSELTPGSVEYQKQVTWLQERLFGLIGLMIVAAILKGSSMVHNWKLDQIINSRYGGEVAEQNRTSFRNKYVAYLTNLETQLASYFKNVVLCSESGDYKLEQLHSLTIDEFKSRLLEEGNENSLEIVRLIEQIGDTIKAGNLGDYLSLLGINVDYENRMITIWKDELKELIKNYSPAEYIILNSEVNKGQAWSKTFDDEEVAFFHPAENQLIKEQDTESSFYERPLRCVTLNTDRFGAMTSNSEQIFRDNVAVTASWLADNKPDVLAMQETCFYSDDRALILRKALSKVGYSTFGIACSHEGLNLGKNREGTLIAFREPVLNSEYVQNIELMAFPFKMSKYGTWVDHDSALNPGDYNPGDLQPIPMAPLIVLTLEGGRKIALGSVQFPASYSPELRSAEITRLHEWADKMKITIVVLGDLNAFGFDTTLPARNPLPSLSFSGLENQLSSYIRQHEDPNGTVEAGLNGLYTLPLLFAQKKNREEVRALGVLGVHFPETPTWPIIAGQTITTSNFSPVSKTMDGCIAHSHNQNTDPVSVLCSKVFTDLRISDHSPAEFTIKF